MSLDFDTTNKEFEGVWRASAHALVTQMSHLASQKIAITIAAFSNRKFEIATLTAGSAEKLRNEIANRCVSKSQTPIAMFLPVNSKDQSKVAKLSENKNRCDLWGCDSNCSISAFSKSQHFRDAKTLSHTPQSVPPFRSARNIATSLIIFALRAQRLKKINLA